MKYPQPDIVYARVHVTDKDGVKSAVFTDHPDNDPASVGTKVMVIACDGAPALCFDGYIVPVGHYLGPAPADTRHPGVPDVTACTTALAEKIGKIYERRIDTFVEERDRTGKGGSYTILDKIKKGIAKEKNFRRVMVDSCIDMYRMGADGRHHALEAKEWYAVMMNKLPSDYKHVAIVARLREYNLPRKGNTASKPHIGIRDVSNGRTKLPDYCEVTGEELEYGKRSEEDTNNCVDIIVQPSLDAQYVYTEQALDALTRKADAIECRLNNPGRNAAVNAVVQGSSTARQEALKDRDRLLEEHKKEYLSIMCDTSLSDAEKDEKLLQWDHRKAQILSNNTVLHTQDKIRKQAKVDAGVDTGKYKRTLRTMREQERLMAQRLQDIETERISKGPDESAGKQVLVVCDYVACIINPWRYTGEAKRSLAKRTAPRTAAGENYGFGNGGYPSVEKLVDYVVRIGTPEQIKRLYESLQKAAKAEGYPVEKAFPCVQPTLQDMYHAQDL